METRKSGFIDRFTRAGPQRQQRIQLVLQIDHRESWAVMARLQGVITVYITTSIGDYERER